MDEIPQLNPNYDLLEKLRVNKESAFKHRRRRHFDWTENYTLYRDKVMLNRLTQRQSVNIPLIKSSIKTLLKDIDDPPQLFFTNLDNNDQAEVFYNEYWKFAMQRNNLIIKDIVDKRQVLLFGRSFKALNIVNGHFYWEIVDPQDMLVDRYVDPADIDTARYLIREHIYVPLSSLKANPIYDNAAVSRIQKQLGTDAGLIKAEQNQLDWVEKQRREASLGVIDAFYPILGETYVELNEFYIKEYDDKLKEDVIKFIVTAEDMEVLFSSTQEDFIGETSDNYWRSHYRFSTWADETERTDFWSDGVADTLRTLNKVVNTFYSQMIENRTLQNFKMQYFNSSLTDEGFLPQTFEPVPWGWYPIPVQAGGKITDNIMPVDVGDLTNNIEEINFIMQIAQQASAATSFEQGVKPEGQTITLGEVQILQNNAEQRIKAMSVYYNEAWKDFGLKYVKMLEASSDLIDETIIHKKGKLTKRNYAKKVTPEMWYSEAGYKCEVVMKQDMQEQTADELQKLQYSKSLMPQNMTLDTIIKKKSLEFSDLTSTEIADVLKEDERQIKLMQSMTMGQPGMPGQAQGTPGQPAPTGVPQLGAGINPGQGSMPAQM